MVLRSTGAPTLFAVAVSCGLAFAATAQANPPNQAPASNAAAPASDAASPASHASVGLVRSPPGGLQPGRPVVMRHVRKQATLKGTGPASGTSP
jgi:hypothetical protein